MTRRGSLAWLVSGLGRRAVAFGERLEFLQVKRRVFEYRDCFETVRAALDFCRPRKLCDIGANAGHWTWVMKQLNPELEHAVMFEPQQRYQAELSRLDLDGVKKQIVQKALGDTECIAVLHGGTASASLLVPSESQSRLFPGSVGQEQEKVQVTTLDHYYTQTGIEWPDMIKLDVQGFELPVLRGGRECLKHATALIVELSFASFYEGQPPSWEVLRYLDGSGYRLVGRGYEWRSANRSADLLQLDAVFLNCSRA